MGISDIIIWLEILLRNIYKTTLAHGYDYELVEGLHTENDEGEWQIQYFIKR